MEIYFAIAAYIIVGALAGVLGGLLGIGGGVITVPAFYYIFRFLGYPHAYLMHIAIGTSLAAMILNTIASTYAHNRRSGVVWDVFKKMAPGLFVGSVIGAVAARWISGIFLEMFFGLFLCAIAYRFWRHHPSEDGEHRLPKLPILWLWSMAIGGVSNLLGIGGGTLVVPFLTAFRMPAKKAIGTSAACSLLVTCLGSISYLILGLGKVALPEDIGFIDLPAFAIVGVISFCLAPLGAKWAHELPVKRIRKIFACVLLITGISMMV